MTTIDKVSKYLNITIDTDYESTVQEFIDSVTSYIERYTGRTFSYDAEAEASPRVYDGTGSSELFIDDAVEVTEVKVGSTVMDEDDYVLYPSNKTPKTRIILPYKKFYEGAQNVTVTAKWGYGATVPDDLSFAATVLVAGIINSQLAAESGNTGAVQSETIGRYSVTYSTDGGSTQTHDFSDAMKTLKLYRRMA